MIPTLKRRVPAFAVVGALALAGWYYWSSTGSSDYGDAFIGSNGRIEATEIDVSTKLAGRVEDIMANEGDFVRAGEPLARMKAEVLEAQLAEAKAQNQQAINAVASALAMVAARESDRAAALAIVAQRESERTLARQRLERSEKLAVQGATSRQTLDEDRAAAKSSEAVLAAARAQVAAADAAITAARAQVTGAQSAVVATEATVARIQADLDDTTLIAPRDGRVQYRIAQPGEVLGNGGKVLNLIDLNDVYMTFFVPEAAAGRIALGQEVRLVLDAAPEFVIPATVSYVSSTAQFTPKTVETASERQKLMFRVKAHIDRALLQKHVEQVKTGIPGMAWLRLDEAEPWPPALTIKVPQ